MTAVRIKFRLMGYGTQSYTPLLPGEPVFDPVSRRMGVGINGYRPVWFPRATTQGNLEFDQDQGLVSSDGQLSLKFKATGVSWTVSGNEVFATRGSDGVSVRSGILMRNSAGADVVVIGYGHYIALMTLLLNLKKVLRKLLLGTATGADIDAIYAPNNTLDLTALDPAFPEAPAL